MPLGTPREKVLYGLSKGRSTHRYTRWRWAVAVVFTLGVALLPLLSVLRFDFWGGRHLVLGRELGLVEAAKAFAFPFLAVNVAIVIASRFIGRYLCGFVCPYGALARMAEWLRWRGRRSPGRKLIGTVGLLSFCLLLAAITFSFWVDWRVFVAGSPVARVLSAGFLLGTAAALYLGARYVGLRFCRDWCPCGVYFALLGPETNNGVEFHSPETCTECKACERVCPVDLNPTEMLAEPRGAIGFYPAAATNFALCIRCGDCVKACESTTEDHPGEIPLRMGFLPTKDEAHGGEAQAAADESEGDREVA